MIKMKVSLLVVCIIMIVAVPVACTPGTQTANSIATSVAATVKAGVPASSSTVFITATSESLPAATALPTATISPIRVSFVNTAHNLFVWSDGTAAPVQLTTSGDVVESYVSPDGALIAYIRSTDLVNYEVDIINYDGSNQRVLLFSSQINALPRSGESIGMEPNKIVWIPGSHRLAMNFRVSYEGPGLEIADSLYILDADSAAFSPLVSVGNAWNFVYSPDGSKLLITRPEGIDLYNADGTLVQANVITHAFVNTASEYAWVAAPAWSVDSGAFAVGIPPQDPWATTPEPSTVYKVSSNGSILSSFAEVISFSSTNITTFSPDLAKMSYAVQVGAPEDNNWALHISGLDGSEDSTIMTGYFSKLASWAPDGGHFLFTVMDGSTKHTYLGSLGAAPVLLPEISSMLDIRWIDDTRYIISSKEGTVTSLMLGAVGSSFGVIYNDTGSEPDRFFNFDVNR